MSRPPQTGNLFKNPYSTPNGNNDTHSSTNGNGNQANGVINEQGWQANGQHGNGQARPQALQYPQPDQKKEGFNAAPLPSAQPPRGAQQGPVYQGQPNASTHFASGMFTNAHQSPAMPPSPTPPQPVPPWIPQQQQPQPSVPPSGPLNAGPPSGIRQSGNAWPMGGPQGPMPGPQGPMMGPQGLMPGPQGPMGPQGPRPVTGPMPGPQGPMPGSQGPMGPQMSMNGAPPPSPPMSMPGFGPMGGPQGPQGPGPYGPGPMPGGPGSQPFPPQHRPSQPLPGPGGMHPAARAKRGLIQRARARYQRLSRRSRTLLVVLAIALVFPMLLTIVEGINTYLLYNQVRSGIQHLNNVKSIFAAKDKNGNTVIFDVAKLKQAQPEVDAAHDDFAQLSEKLHNDALVGLLGGVFPGQIATARSLSDIGVSAMEIAQQGVKSAIVIAPTLSDPTLKDQSKPLANATMMDQARVLVDYALPRVKSMVSELPGIQLDSLPLNDSQRQMLGSVITLLPKAVGDMEMAQDFLKTKALDWLIGVDKPRNFLVQTMDRGELRSTGGFTGQFGMMPINGGRMGKLDLQNVGIYEENLSANGIPNDTILSKIVGTPPPDPYNWWPIPNFGIRDSNVSADFPSTAKVTMNLFNQLYPTNHPDKFQPADGLIMFSPFLIAQLLRITGPVKIEAYNETITADNLEDKLHFYQLDNAGILKEITIEHLEGNPDVARKMFTKRVSEVMMNRVKSLSADQIVNLLPTMLEAMKTRDLQVYFDNQQANELIAKYGSAATIDTSNDHDGIFIVQSNVSVSKASQYVRTYVKDDVTLDASGGATHVMTMRLAYTQLGSVYGMNTYFDYMRVYVPENSHFLWGKGFTHMDTGYCGLRTGIICQTDVFGDGTQICPPGSDTNFRPLFRDTTADGDINIYGIYQTGKPTNMESDTPGRNMFGGWVEIQKNCNMTIALSWYVPNVAKDKQYSLLFQRQSGVLPIVDLNVLPTPGDCAQLKTSGVHFAGVLGGEDKLLTVPTGQSGGESGCYVKMQV